MESTKRKYARFQGFNEWEDFKASIETEEEYNIHESIMMYIHYPKPRLGIAIGQKKDRAIYTGDRLSCLRAARLLIMKGENIFQTTRRWLIRGECKFPYVYFDEDQWHGTDTLELIEFNKKGKKYIKQLKLC